MHLVDLWIFKGFTGRRREFPNGSPQTFLWGRRWSFGGQKMGQSMEKLDRGWFWEVVCFCFGKSDGWVGWSCFEGKDNSRFPAGMTTKKTKARTSNCPGLKPHSSLTFFVGLKPHASTQRHEESKDAASLWRLWRHTHLSNDTTVAKVGHTMD